MKFTEGISEIGDMKFHEKNLELFDLMEDLGTSLRIQRQVKI